MDNFRPSAGEPFLIGYFMRNEPAWAYVYDLNIAEEMLANPAERGIVNVTTFYPRPNRICQVDTRHRKVI